MCDQPRIVGLVCNWCTYAAADLAGLLRKKYSHNIKLIRIPCSGRVTPHFILTAFQNGADGVFIGGCRPGDCHYSTGNFHARYRFELIKSLMVFTGLNPERLTLEWISASEAQEFTEAVEAFTVKVKKLCGGNPVLRSCLED
ncbi:MAG: Methyl-viologen-reducing hydrogenase, delta subunit [Firmicutes bacterium ADurb.Bin419]|nr:MAG: Methyl-viologen-reducing hydrogenase, delta subunit [Firmicutes bacterium ADurb.Bin419]